MVLFLFLFCLLIIPLVSSVRAKSDLLSPINIFCLLYMISFVVMPIFNHARIVSYDPAYANYNDIYEFKAQILSIMALLFFYLGYYYERGSSKGIHNALPKFQRVLSEKKAHYCVILIWLVSMASFFYLIRSFYISINSFVEYFAYTNVSSFGRGHVALLCYSYIFAFFICVIAIFDRGIKQRRFFLFFFILSLVLAFLSRSRGHLLLILFISMVFYNYRRNKLEFSKSVILFIFALAIVFFVAQFRGTKDYRLNRDNFYFSFGGLFTEFQATATLLSEYEEGKLEHFNGQITFQDLAFSLIPRRFWHNKPELYGGIFVTNILVPNRQFGFYYTVGPFSVAFADFGYIGIILMMFLTGFLMKVIYNYMQRNKENDFILLLYAIICFHIWAFMRGGFGAVPSLLQTLIPVVFVYFLISEKNTNLTPTIARCMPSYKERLSGNLLERSNRYVTE